MFRKDAPARKNVETPGARKPYFALVEIIPITSSEPELAATKAMPVIANGSERPASKNCAEVLLRRRRRSPVSRMRRKYAATMP